MSTTSRRQRFLNFFFRSDQKLTSRDVYTSSLLRFKCTTDGGGRIVQRGGGTIAASTSSSSSASSAAAHNITDQLAPAASKSDIEDIQDNVRQLDASYSPNVVGGPLVLMLWRLLVAVWCTVVLQMVLVHNHQNGYWFMYYTNLTYFLLTVTFWYLFGMWFVARWRDQRLRKFLPAAIIDAEVAASRAGITQSAAEADSASVEDEEVANENVPRYGASTSAVVVPHTEGYQARAAVATLAQAATESSLLLPLRNQMENMALLPSIAPPASFLEKTGWVLFEIVCTSCIFLDLFYWAGIYAQEGGPPPSWEDINLHVVNTVFVLVELLIGKWPLPFMHSAFAVGYTALYVICVWIVNAAGGVVWPYEFMKWDANPATSALYYIGLFFGNVGIFMACMLIAKARDGLANWLVRGGLHQHKHRAQATIRSSGRHVTTPVIVEGGDDATGVDASGRVAAAERHVVFVKEPEVFLDGARVY